jgi:pimeloyl-ACP methyl ester carboxylesterase
MTVTDGSTVASRLVEAGARVIGIDARGHGGSDGPTDPEHYRGDAHALDVVRVIDAVGDGAVDVVGYSMGSVTAMRLLGIEERLRSVVLGGTGPLHVEGYDDELWQRLQTAGRCLLADDFSAHPELTIFGDFVRLDPDTATAGVGAALIGLEPAPPDRLTAARVPVTVLNGSQDYPEDADALAALIPGAVGAVAGVGDHPTSPSDDEYQREIVDILARHW